MDETVYRDSGDSAGAFLRMESLSGHAGVMAAGADTGQSDENTVYHRDICNLGILFRNRKICISKFGSRHKEWAFQHSCAI